MLGFVEAWQTLVDEVEAGYGGDLYEYEAELLVREDLERAMVSSELASVDGWASIGAQILVADSQFRELLGPVVREGSPWWKARVPARAGAEFAADVQRIYGVTIEASDE
ncbi:hypothetical protein [Promicromonospora sp. AC04]|uniref:hypothetical protein n=1 Tax=Promicromonospora sp. AC04 TaxID=2135723 RepID=UPI000D39F4EB|nr:hypothetical protein [Promicromonospora sp. AC04]